MLDGCSGGRSGPTTARTLGPGSHTREDSTVQELRLTSTTAAKPPRPEPSDAQLRALATARPDLAWPVGADIARARNAHVTNTRHELGDALAHDFDWLEADVRVGANGQPVMQHDLEDPPGLELTRWLEFVAPSGRGIKLDVKERAAMPATLAAVRRAGISEHRLIMNVGGWPAPELLKIRTAFPQAIINLSPVSDGDLSSRDLVRLQVAARLVGGPVMFPLRHDLVTPPVVSELRPFGRVAVWNSPSLTNPGPESEPELRAMGVDGMVDLREPVTFKDRTQSAAVGFGVKLFGWDAVHKALAALDLY